MQFSSVSDRYSIVLATLLTAALVACAKDPDVVKRSHLERGQAFASKGQYDQAIIEYRSALKYDPKYGEARLRLGEAYAATRVRDKAAAELVRAADLLPDSIEAQIKAGYALLVKGSFTDAEARADGVIKKQGVNADALLLKGYALAGLRRTSDAIEQIEEALSLNPLATTGRVNLGALLLREGNREAAETTFNRARELAPDSVEANLALAQFYWAYRRYPETEAVLLTMAKAHPADVGANRALAAFYLTTGRPLDAEPYVKSVAHTLRGGALVLADYYVATNRPQQARDLLRDAAGTNTPERIGALLRGAALDYVGGDRDAAHRMVDQVLAKQPRLVTAVVLKAQFLMTDGRLREALERAQAAVTIDPQFAAAFHVLGLIQRRLDDRPAAIAAFTEVLKLNPRAADAQTELAALELERGKVTSALAFSEEARRRAPQNREAHLVLVKSLVANGDGQRADVEASALIARFPDWAPGHAIRGVVELKKRNYTSATDAFQRALALDPASVDALQGLVSVKVATGRPAEGRALLNARMAQGPTSPEIVILLAELDIAERNYSAAERNFLRALEIDGEHLRAYSRLAQMYSSQRRLDDAQRKYEEITARQPNDLVAQTMVAVLLQLQGRPGEAITRYEHVLRLDRRAAVAANNLAWLYAERGEQLDLALQLAQTAKQELPTVTGVTDTLGWVSYKKNLLPQAIAAFEEITQLEPRNAEYQYHLGLAYAKAGEARKARRALEEALRVQPDSPVASDARRVLGTLKTDS